MTHIQPSSQGAAAGPAATSGPTSSPRTRTTRAPIALDEMGTELEVRIRIAPDGRVYFHDIPMAMLDVVAAIAPANKTVAERRQLAQAYRRPIR